MYVCVYSPIHYFFITRFLIHTETHLRVYFKSYFLQEILPGSQTTGSPSDKHLYSSYAALS